MFMWVLERRTAQNGSLCFLSMTSIYC